MGIESLDSNIEQMNEAQTTLAQAREAYNDARYRVALDLAELQGTEVVLSGLVNRVISGSGNTYRVSATFDDKTKEFGPSSMIVKEVDFQGYFAEISEPNAEKESGIRIKIGSLVNNILPDGGTV